MTSAVAVAAGLPERHRTSLAAVLDDLGATMLDLALGEERLGSPVSGVVIHDSYDATPPPPGSLVLGVGAHEPPEVAALLHRLGSARAVGLVVRAPLTIDEGVRRAVAASRVALLVLTRGASWTQLTALLRSVPRDGDGPVQTGTPAVDLFALANAVSALVDAPITIEDLNACPIAFSARQDEADPTRFETILSRRCPDRFRELLEERGVYGRLYRSDRPVPVLIPGAAPRVAVALRAGDEVLGAMWAVTHGLTPEREQAFADAAELVALHIVRQRAGANIDRRLRSELVATVLGGGERASGAASRLGIATVPAVVMALGTVDTDRTAPARVEADRQRLADAFAVHLFAAHPEASAALLGEVLYGILPARGEDGDRRAVRIAEEFRVRTGHRLGCVVGVGRVAATGADLVQSRRDAERALRVVRTGSPGRPVVRISDVYAEALILELSDLVISETSPPDGSMRRLIEYDAEHGAQLVVSLRAWLDAFGDVNAAAAAVHVHPSTFRYRLRRVAEVGGFDLEDGDQRFAAMLQLRLLGGLR